MLRAASGGGAIVFGATSEAILEEAARREARIDVRAPDSAQAAAFIQVARDLVARGLA